MHKPLTNPFVPALQDRAGTESALGNRMAWYVQFVGGGQYMIESVYAPDIMEPFEILPGVMANWISDQTGYQYLDLYSVSRKFGYHNTNSETVEWTDFSVLYEEHQNWKEKTQWLL